MLWGVDAFAEEDFSGNPAAVCLLEAPADPGWMQRVAAEMNLSETAFLVPGRDAWGLRWFTPTVEVALCGHATLASAHVLWETGRASLREPVRFQTQESGVLVCRRGPAWIEMDFPARPARETAPPPGLVEALGESPRWVGRSADDYLCELADEAAVRNLQPQFPALARLPVRGVIVTAPGSGRFDCVSRFFAPGAGVAEDPVTGSAHCTLAPFWSQRLSRLELLGWQASTRGGAVRMRHEGERVALGGKARTMWQGEWRGAQP